MIDNPTAAAVPIVLSPAAAARRRKMLSPFLMRLFFLAKLPLALFAGVRLRELDADHAVATVPYGWRSTNPFRSTYFAAQAMAAELATGALAMLAVDQAPRSVALLIVNMTASFEKKATGLTTFTCSGGRALADAVARAAASGEPASAEVEAVGRSADGAVVARFTFTWSFKARTR
jgi:Domain of unknown function (DUF4442)